MITCASSSPFTSSAHRVSSMVSAIAFELFCAFSAILLAVVCSTLGAIAGAMGGLKTQSGFLHGTIVGSIIGCTISTEISALSYALWNPEDSAIRFFVPLIKITSKILKERLAQHTLNSVQVSGEIQVDDAQLAENQVQHTCSSSRSSSRDPADKIRKIILTARNIVDTLWNGASCTICLQDFQLGETVCLLRRCRHTFHASCIDKWFIGHTSCPLCRADLRCFSR